MRATDPRLRRQLAPARWLLGGVVAAGTVASILVIAQAWIVAGLILAALDGGHLARWSVAALAVLAARGLVGLLGDGAAAAAARIVGTDLRRRLVLAATRRGTASSGEVSVLATRGVSAAEPYLTRYVPAVVLACVLPLLTLVAIATQDLLSALIVVCTLPLLPLFGALVGLATRDRAAEQWCAMGALAGYFLDVVRGLPTLVAHRRARAQSDRIREVTDRYRRASAATLQIAFLSSAVLELVATLSVAVVAVTVGVRLAGGSLDLHTALVVLLLAPEAYWPLRRMGAEFHAAAEGVATFEAADGLLAASPPPDPGAEVPTGVALELHGLSVCHPGRTRAAVERLSTTIPATGVTVVTGPSGCGKSTLLLALAGLLPPTEGTSAVGGIATHGTAWQRQVSWLPQRPHFVVGTIADNLRLADPDATDETLWDALRQVALEERVLLLPGGLAAAVGEDGSTFSAGERARLALARVVVADRPWALLDEPTAHLDALTEQVIADTIVALGRRGAVVVVAHRPALVDLADRILALPAPVEDHADGPVAGAAGSSSPTPAMAPASGSTPPAAFREAPPVPPAPPRRRDEAAGVLLSALASAAGVALTATAGWLIVQASTQPAVLTMLVAIVAVRTFGLARPVLRYAERLMTHDTALRLLAERRAQVYDALVPLTPARLGRRRGDMLTSVVDDVDSVVDRALRVRLPVQSFTLVAGAATVIATLFLPSTGLVVAAACLVGGGGGFVLARLGARRSERTRVRVRAELSASVVETIQVADELRMWQATDRAAARVAALSDDLGRASQSAARWLAAARALALVSAGAAMVAVATLAAPAVAAGALSAPVLALLVLLPLALADLALPVADAGALSARTEAAADRLDRLQRTAPAVRDTVALAVTSGHDLALDGVRARWTDESPLTAPVSFDLAPGERIGLVGPSGSGKSTLAALLVRFLDPVAGTIRLGGQRSRDLALDEVRRVTGLVDDDPHVFASTLVENVRLARPDASDAEVAHALRRARLGPWLDSLPDGLATWLGDGHDGVSGGERARIGIARSLLADQPLLVLDEPAAHLDHGTAEALAREVLEADETRAVLWITHSEVGLDLVDRVVDLGAAATSEHTDGRSATRD